MQDHIELSRNEFFSEGLIARGLKQFYPRHELVPRHDHPWAQLVFAASGSLQVNTHDASWIVPTTRAIWIPADVEHWHQVRADVAMRTLYINVAGSAFEWPDQCIALDVSHLLREVILHCVDLDSLLHSDAEAVRALGFLSDLIKSSNELNVHLPRPKDRRSVAVADALIADCSLSPEELALASGASIRTLQRLFLKETGLRLSEWRQLARMHAAVVLLADGVSVAEVAEQTGYQSSSAFGVAFKATFGVPASEYIVKPRV